MALNFTAGIVRILLGPHKGTAGTGFVVSNEGLVATCAHVVEDAHAGPGDTVSLIFYAAQDTGEQKATVLREYWRASGAEDVAILRLESGLPEKVKPLPLGRFLEKKHFSTFGFPNIASVDGRWGEGRVLGSLKMNGFKRLQLRSEEITKGVSGAPIWDDDLGVVIGVVIGIGKGRSIRWDRAEIVIPADPYGQFKHAAFATPTETLWQIYPDLRPADQCPYRNLEAFTRNDADLFFGRERVLDKLIKNLQDEPRFLAVLGPSGCGKSSLVQAGLLPLLEKEAVFGSNLWEIILTRPTDSAFTNVVTSLPQKLQHKKQRHIGLIIDQFEELFATYPEEKCQEIVALLMQLLERTQRIHLILTVRNDFYSHFGRFETLEKWIDRGVVNVSFTLRRDEVKDMIQKPAKVARLRFDEGLVEIIVNDVLAIQPSPGARELGAPNTVLPLLEFALTQLWERRDKDQGMLTLATYRNIGGVTGGLKQWANGVYYALSERERELARRIFIQLAYVNDDETLSTPYSRLRKPKDELIRITESEWGMVEQVIKKLISARLLVTPQSEDEASTKATVEIIHDALLSEWNELRRWLDDDRRFMIWRQEIKRRAQAWKKSGAGNAKKHDKGMLLRGGELAESTGWIVKRKAEIDKAEQDFIKISRKRQQRVQNGIITTLLIFLAIASVLASVAGLNYLRAEKELQIAQSQRLAAQAQNYMLKNQFDLALLLSVKAYQTDNNYETRDTLLTTLENSSHINKMLHNYTDFAFSSDGRTLLSSRSDGTITLWNLATGKSRSLLIPIQKGCEGVWLIPDGKRAASLCTYGLEVWDIKTGKQLVKLPLKASNQGIGRHNILTFSRDGHLLAVYDGNGNIVIWNLDSGRSLGPPFSAYDPTIVQQHLVAMPTAFSPDGKLLVSSLCWSLPIEGPCGVQSDQHEIFVWDVASGKRISTLTSRQFGVMSLTFSPNGQFLATGGANGTIALWDMKTQRPLGSSLIGHTGPVQSLAFSRNGKTLVSGSADKTVRLWDVATQQNSGDPLLGHQAGVSTVLFSPDGQQLVSGSSDNMLIIWNLTSGSPIRQELGGCYVNDSSAFDPSGYLLASIYSDGIDLCDVTTGTSVGILPYNITAQVEFSRRPSLAFSRDGRLLASFNDDATITLWNVATKKLVKNFKSAADNTHPSSGELTFSPDGRLLALYGDSIHFTLLDITTGQPRQLRNHGSVAAIAFSSDGGVIALGGSDNTITLVDVATGEPIGQPLSDRGGVYPVAFSADGRTLVSRSSSSGTIALWDTIDQKLIRRLPIESVDDVELSPDGKILVIPEAGSLTLWDMTSQEIVAHPLLGPFTSDDPSSPSNIVKIMFGPNGQLLTYSVAARGGSAAILWNINITSWIAHACSIASRNLTLAEWKQFVGQEPYQRVCLDLPL